MKTLCKQTVDTIKRTVETGKIFNIEVLVIDRQGIRAKSDASYIFLSERADMQFLEFDSLCIDRISNLNDRLNFMEKIGGKGGFEMTLSGVKELDSGDKIATKLRLITTGTAVEIGCADGARYKLPWTVDDANLVSFNVDNNSSEVLNGFSRTVQNKNRSINIKGVDGIIVVTSIDDVGDTATHILSDSPTFNENQKDFSFIFSIGNLLPMLRGRLNTQFTLTERGILITEINGLNVMIFPEKRTST